MNPNQNATARRKREGGFVVLTELILIVTIVGIGSIVGLVAIRDAYVAEMHDIAESVGSIDQSYSYDGNTDLGTGASTGSGQFVDEGDVDGASAGATTGDAGTAGDDLGINFALPAPAQE